LPPITGTKTDFIARTNALQASIGRLEDRAVRRAVQLLNEAKRKINARVLTEDGWRKSNLRNLQAQVHSIMADFERDYARAFTQINGEVYELAVQSVDDPLAVSGVTLQPARLSRNVVEVLQGFSADLIRNVGQQARTNINAAITQAMLGLESPFDAQRRISDIIGVRDDARKLTGISARAQSTFRTEVGRIQGIATQARQQQVAERVDDIEKRWVATGDNRTRSGHLAAHGQSVPVDGFFLVARVKGERKEELRFPKDPRGSAGNVINCRCRTATWRKGYGEFLPRTSAKVEEEEASRRRRR
jgi:hypothetical protein